MSPSETLPTSAREAGDHRQAPLLEAARRYHDDEVVAFSTPGHKRGRGIDDTYAALFGAALLSLDIPLGGGIDDTHFQADTLAAAEALGADAWRAERSFYLVNGSSAGNHAYLLAALRPGDEVIVARDMHKSLLVALILAGAVPIYVAPRLHPLLDVGLGIEPGDVAAALDNHPNARLVTLVSPSYCGVATDVAAVTRVAHEWGVPVYVDQAWGPHFGFHPDLPPSAMMSGADGAVVSTHKILGALTQSAVLNVQGGLVDPRSVKTAVGMVQTTSPSVPILASIDACRRQMALSGERLLGETIALAEEAARRLRAVPGIGVLGPDDLGIAAFDRTKLVVDVHRLGLSGFEAEALLRHRFHIQPEMSDLLGCVFLVTIGDRAETIDQLVAALAAIADQARDSPRHETNLVFRSSGSVIAPGTQALAPREAFFAPSLALPLGEAIGCVSAELVIPYPPGIPVLAPGDIIAADKVAYLQEGTAHGMYLSGPIDSRLRTIRVVA